MLVNGHSRVEQPVEGKKEKQLGRRGDPGLCSTAIREHQAGPERYGGKKMPGNSF